MISFIVAYANNQVMGKDNQLPWQIKDDLKLFKQYTLDKPIVMGRKTFDSIGYPLPNRRNIILTRQSNFQQDNIEVCHSVSEINSLLEEEPEIMVIGGAEIFKLFMPQVKRLYVSKIDAQIEGDTYFPLWNEGSWHQVLSQPYPKSDRNQYAFEFEIWER